ncbi:Utp21-domain-containing protein [Multifurca ochricompacta]|uniref:Utp21-domain-containing protein n=1 Tax=Multifurca ochricompacta TaxID=376703 RepID=A0AAD4MAK7_9AGAM|nr:Utp21-domain-containing protein [Multifurca ochricompacta]
MPIVVVHDDPPRKRIRSSFTYEKTGDLTYTSISTESFTSRRLFAPFRALGLITNEVPFALQLRAVNGSTGGPCMHVLTCLGNSWALWEGESMGLLFVGSETQDLITGLAFDGDFIWASSGPHVIKYRRGKEVSRLTNPLETPVTSPLVFGSHLLTLTEDGRNLLTWDVPEKVLHSQIQFEPSFTAVHLLHPATYLNKVLIGGNDGSLQLWNIRTQTCVHKIPFSHLSQSSPSNSPCSVTALAQSPAIDVIGVGFASGEISIYDIRADEKMMRILMREGPVQALAFRNDGHPVLASASEVGHIYFWDLGYGGRLLHTVRGAHDGSISALEWVPGQPLLISSGDDNSIKQWHFDSQTSPPRLLKFRSGHQAPPHLIRYYGEDGKQLLTASRDRSLRYTSVVRDSRSFELSQGSFTKKASALSIPLTSLKHPPITALSYSTTRSKDWDDILTAHSDEAHARTWSMLNKRLGQHALGVVAKTKSNKPGTIKAVCVSACGNFGLVSSSTGAIHLWNMQSGACRKSFNIGACPEGVHAKYRPPGKQRREERSVTGLVMDSLNRMVIAGTLDGTVNFFDFHTEKLEYTFVIPAAVVSMTLQRDSGLLAVTCDDLAVRLLDIETRRLVREFSGFGGRVLDLTFSPDSRWLITTSLDSIIRTFDIPSGRLIDAFRTASIATSISFSPTSDFLATAHINSVGVYLWANRAQYTDVPFRSIIEEDVERVNLPSMLGSAEDEAPEHMSTLVIHDRPQDIFGSMTDPDSKVITLTLLPRSRWETLLNLDVIQHRNKPKEPPKAPEKAPFFLPTLPGVESRFVVQGKEMKTPTRQYEKSAANAESVFVQKLSQEQKDSNYETFFGFAKSLSPAGVDLEIRSLATVQDFGLFLNALSQRLHSRRDFEAVQTYLNLFLRAHGEILVSSPELRSDLEALLVLQRKESSRLLDSLNSCFGTLAFVRDTL